MEMNFVAIDVEIANPNFASICQVGVAAFRDGSLHDTWESLVDPEDYFDEMNVAIHGIDENAVRGAPKWQAVHELLAPWLQGRVVGLSRAIPHLIVQPYVERVRRMAAFLTTALGLIPLASCGELGQPSHK